MRARARLIPYSPAGTWGPKVTADGTNIVITDGDRKLSIPYTALSKPQDVRQASALSISQPLFLGSVMLSGRLSR